MSQPIRVLLADSHTLTQKGVQALLQNQPQIELVGEVETLEEAQSLCASVQPDVLILARNLPDQTILDTAAFLKQSCSQVNVLVLTGKEDEAAVHTLLAAGVVGYWLKDKSAESLISAIQRTARGERTIDPDVLEVIISSQQEDVVKQLLQTLTQREQETLQYIGQGDSNYEIAAHLGISANTVASYVNSIYEKLQIKNRAKLVAWLWQNKVVTYN